MKMEFKIGVTVEFDGNTGDDQKELDRKMDSAIDNNLAIMEACSIGILPPNALIYGISSEAGINFFTEQEIEKDEKQA